MLGEREQVLEQVAADKAAGAGHQNDRRSLPRCCVLRLRSRP